MDADVFWSEPDGRVTAMSPGDGLYFMACVHPSGTHAVCWGGAAGRPRLWWGDGSGAFEPITDGAHAARYPAFNLRGDVLVYCRSDHPSETMARFRRARRTLPAPAASMGIVLRAADGAWERELTDGSHLDQRPAVSPDGSRVVFVSDRRGPYELWTVDASGGEPEPLLTGVRAYRPWWSVDGRHVFFVALGPRRHGLHVVPAAGGEPMPLRNDGRGDTHGPYADPDGRHVIAHSTRARRWALYEFPLDGSLPRWLGPGAHGTRARNGVLTFDVSRRPGLR